MFVGDNLSFHWQSEYWDYAIGSPSCQIIENSLQVLSNSQVISVWQCSNRYNNDGEVMVSYNEVVHLKSIDLTRGLPPLEADNRRSSDSALVLDSRRGQSGGYSLPEVSWWAKPKKIMHLTFDDRQIKEWKTLSILIFRVIFLSITLS